MLEPDGVSWTRVRGTSRSFLVWPTSPTTTVSWHWKHQSSPTLYHHLSSYPHTPIHKTLPIRQTFSTQTVWARPDGLSKAEGQRNLSGLEGVLQIGVGSAKTPRTIVAGPSQNKPSWGQTNSLGQCWSAFDYLQTRNLQSLTWRT